MSRDDSWAIFWRGDWNNVGLSRIESIGLVGFKDTGSNFAVSKTEYQIVWMLFGPSHACDWGRDRELVADGFFFAPVESDLVDEDDVVTLSNSDFGGVGREFQSPDEVWLLSLVRWFGWELVFFLSIFVKEIDRLNKEG